MNCILTLAHCWGGHEQTGLSLLDVIALIGSVVAVSLLIAAATWSLRRDRERSGRP